MFQKSTAYFSLFIGLFLSILILLFPPKVQFNYDFEQFFPQKSDDLEFYQWFRNEFENDNDYLLVAIENSKGELLNRDFLAKALEVQTELSELNDVDTIISILNFQKPIIGLFGSRWEKVMKWGSDEELVKSSKNLEQYRSKLISKDGKSILFWIKNTQNISKENGDILYEEIQKVFDRNELPPKAVAGKIQAQGDFIKLMQKEFGLFFGASILLILVMLFLIFRSFWAVWIPVLVLLIGTLWAFAIFFYFGKSLDVMSIMQPTIFLIVGLSALVHFITHFNIKFQKSNSKGEAVNEVFKELFIPVGLTILTTSVGFISLFFTTIPALKNFGLSTGIGVLIMFFAIILLTPGLLFLVRIKINRSSDLIISSRFLASLLSAILERKKLIIFSFLVISLSGIWAGTSIKINGFLLDNLPQDHPIQQDVDYFDKQFGGSNPLELYLEVGSSSATLLDYNVLQEIDKIEKKLFELIGSNQIISPLTLVKTLNQAQNQGNENAYVFPSPGQFKRMEKYLERDLNSYGIKILSDQNRSGRVSARSPDFGTYRMSQIRSDLIEYVNTEIDSRYLQVKWTGTAYLMDKGHKSVTVQMAKGLGFAFLVVGIIAGILFRSWRISFILLIPNIIPLIWMLGLMLIIGVDFKLTTAILFTVAFGIAVDDSIHFMTRLRFELGKGKSLFYAIKRTFLETGKAIVLTSLILVCGFGLLIFSEFGVTHFTGLLIAASLIFALLADLFLLPLLLLPMKKVWEKKAKKLIS
ncbi:MMPL family transporter [Algoriphagus sp.]|uniref:efflux RND transporter permease subunit n=1 Tax=Algoriphagus sp. TaxID=1872435 RepID=UPI0025E1B58B|nr:MMPL family transporter [Algoriphagus sp.]